MATRTTLTTTKSSSPAASRRSTGPAEKLRPSQKVTAIVAGAAIVLCLIWILMFIVRSDVFKGPTQEPTGQAYMVVKELNAQLNADHAFLDVGFGVLSEEPMQFEVVGAVYSPADMERLKTKLKELRPEGDYEFKVELMKK